MKTLTAIVLLFLFSCSSPEDKAKDLIKKHLSKTMKDYSSYEPVEFGKIDTLFTSADDDPEYQFLEKWRKSLYDSVSALVIEGGRQQEIDRLESRSDSLSSVTSSMIGTTPKKFKGWRIYHRLQG